MRTKRISIWNEFPLYPHLNKLVTSQDRFSRLSHSPCSACYLYFISNVARFGSTYTKIGITQRRLAWPLHTDDVQVCQVFHDFYRHQEGSGPYMWGSKRDTDIKNSLLDSVGEGKGGGWFERIALKHVYYHMWNRSPVQVGCMRQGAQGWCMGMTLRDGMGRDMGGGFKMGNTCTPMAESCQCMAKTTTKL